MKKLLSVLLALVMLLGLLPMGVTAEEQGETLDFTILSTTDMHGKCWDKNILTDSTETNNMLRVSTAVSQCREIYGDNLLLVDNGDLYQGTPVSTVQLSKIISGESDLPPAMALCLGDIGYDVSVLGNHEFNYSWTAMSKAYDYLASRGVPVITANLYYDGSDGVHERGENVFTPYLIKTVTLNGHEHKLGVLGFENTDCSRWDVPDNYPGMVFAHPDNEAFSIAWEAQRYIPQMKNEGCEFIIVSYHSGTGSASGDLVFGQNTEGQVARLIAECEGIDMVIAGHDHSNAYSNTYLQDKNGKDVLVVNGGGQQLTRSIFTFSEDAEGGLRYTVKETENLNLSGFAVDTALKGKLQPYVDMAVEYVNQPAGTAVGTWDTSSNYYLEQTDTIDLINDVQMVYGSKYMALKYDSDEKKSALFAATGLDHIEVDVSAASPVTSNNYYVKPGEISMKTIVQMYRFDNNVLYLLPLTGQQIKDVLEQNASTRLKAKVRNGAVSYSTIGDDFTNVVFGGLNFTYDMYQPAGSRVVIEGFSNGRAFDPNKTYLVACNSYHLGNPGCGFGDFSPADSVWNQNDDLCGSNIQEAILEYIRDKGEVDTTPFTWTWKLDYSGDPSEPTGMTGYYLAEKIDKPDHGEHVVICYEAEDAVLGLDSAAGPGVLSAVEMERFGDYVTFSDRGAVFQVGCLPPIFVPGLYSFQSDEGSLQIDETNFKLGLAEEFSFYGGVWDLVSAEDGWYIHNPNCNHDGVADLAIKWDEGFLADVMEEAPEFRFGFYRVIGTGHRVTDQLVDGKQYAIYYDAEDLTVSETALNGGLAGVTNTVSGDFMMLPLAEHTLVVTAHIDEAGKIDFTTADGKHLTSNPTGNGIQLTDDLAANDCSLWTTVAVTGGFHVMNVGAAYNNNHNQALEYYGGKFTTYGVRDTDAYLFNFYEIPDLEPCYNGHSWDEGTVEMKPTCTEPGEAAFTCTVCGEGKTEAIPPLGHDYVDGQCVRCGKWDPDLNPFSDVKEGKYYYNAVLWAITRDPQVTKGVDDTHFKPNQTCNRAQVVSFLWNAMGKPEPDMSDNPFMDVKPGKYYYKAVLWAFQTGVTKGADDTHFNPSGLCNRAQVVSFLWNTMGKPEPASTDNPFVDVKPGKYYYKAVLWAVEQGITKGADATHFAPNQTCTRGQVVTFLYNTLD